MHTFRKKKDAIALDSDCGCSYRLRGNSPRII
jgi:hypothetical protein